MTEISCLPALPEQPAASSEPNASAELGQLFSDAAARFVKWVNAEAERMDRGWRRQALLRAYLQRHRWKKSDISRLNKLPLNGAAIRRVVRLQTIKRLGRPIVGNYHSLGENILNIAELIRVIFEPTTSPRDRRRALEQTPWWPNIIEAMYRGEHVAAKRSSRSGPSGQAERAVGLVLHMSPDLVHRICGDIRRQKRAGTALPDSPPITADDFKRWMETGELPATAD